VWRKAVALPRPIVRFCAPNYDFLRLRTPTVAVATDLSGKNVYRLLHVGVVGINFEDRVINDPASIQ
jgi:hypothetical protein